MNNERRKQIKTLSLALDTLRGQLDDIKSLAESIRDDEQEYFDNMPESFQSGDKGQRTEEVIGYLEQAVEHIDQLDGDINEVLDALSSAGE